MSDWDVQVPGFFGVLVGLVVVVLFIAFLAVLPEAVKIVGAPFLYIPDWLGVVQRVRENEVQTMPLGPFTTEFEILEAGSYAVYTRDIDLLTAKVNASESWLIVRDAATGQMIPTYLVERGLRPYDTTLARGRPVFRFQITVPGTYEITREISVGAGVVSIVPDYTTGREMVISLVYVLQLAPIVVPVTLLSYRRIRATRRSRKSRQEEKRTRSDTFWEAEAKRRETHERE